MNAIVLSEPTTNHPVIVGKHQLAWSEPIPLVVRPGTLLIRTRRSLISPGTELAFWEGIHPCIGDPTVPWAQYPFRPGYAAAGVVEEVGAGVEGFAPGDRVAYRGPHAAYAVVLVANSEIAHLPDALGDHLAAFARLAQIAAGVEDAMPARPVGAVVVSGAGLIGILAALWLRGSGLAVRVEDPVPSRRDLAAACGLSVGEPGSVAAPGVIVDATGIADLIPRALERVARGGTVILLGSPRAAINLDVYRLIHGKSVGLVGAHEGRRPIKGERSRQSLFEEVLGRLADGSLPVAPLLTQVIKPTELEEAYRSLAARLPGWLGVELEWDHD